MNKIIYLLMLFLVIPIVSSFTLSNQTHHHPSLSNVTYVSQTTFYGVTARINSTCFTINTTSFCNQSATNIEINITIVTDSTPPIISNLRNTSTTNQSSFIEWSCNEACNYSILWYNSTDLVGSAVNSTFGLSHNPLLTGLLNGTTYFINLTVWDTSGNSANNTAFNFTTAKNVLIPEVLPTIVAGAGSTSSGGCWLYAKNYQTCYYLGNNSQCIHGCPNELICNINYDFNSVKMETLAYCVNTTELIALKEKKTVKAIVQDVSNLIDKIKPAINTIGKDISTLWGKLMKYPFIQKTMRILHPLSQFTVSFLIRYGLVIIAILFGYHLYNERRRKKTTKKLQENIETFK